MFDSVWSVNLTGRTAIVRGLTDRVDRGESVLVVGGRGSGRSRLLADVARSARAPRRWTIQGRDSVPNVPLVPFAGLLADLGVDNSTPLSIYTSLPRVVVDLGGVIVVDDADLLDQASTVLLVQMSRAGVTTIVSAVEQARVGQVLRDHLTTSRWSVQVVPDLTDGDVQKLSEHLLGSPLVVPSAAALLNRVRGNPGLVTELLSAAANAGDTAITPGGAVIEQFAVTPRAIEIAGIDVAGLDDASRSLAELLAVAGELPESLGTPEAVTTLLSARIACPTTPGKLVLVDDLVSDIVLVAVDERRQRELAGRAESALEDADHDGDLRRHLRALAGRPESALDLVTASRRLLDHGRPRQALDLLADVDLEELDAPTRFELLVARSEARSGVGCRDDAMDDLDHAVGLTSRDADLLLVTERWMVLLGGRADDDRALESRIAAVATRFADPDAHARVVAGLARRRAILGQRETSAPGDDAGPGDEILAALRDSLGGTRKSVHSVDPGDAELASGAEGIDALLTVLAQFLMLVYDGDLLRAREIAQAHYDRDAQEARPSLGLWTYNRSKIAFHAGQYETALGLAEEAVRHLAWRDITGQALPADAMLAAILARLGQQERAERMVALLDGTDMQLPRVAIGVARVAAERLRLAGSRDEAATGLVRAGQLAIDQGELYSGALAIDEAFMICPGEDLAGMLVNFDGRSRLVDAFASRAVAMVERDADKVAAAAGVLEQLVQPGRAAHAWRAAAEIWGEQRRSEDARRATQQAIRVASIWQADPWPRPRMDRPALTVRELDVARLAAQRIRSRAIAERLGLSVRTVDNHLARSFRKLGITTREELAEALGLDDT